MPEYYSHTSRRMVSACFSFTLVEKDRRRVRLRNRINFAGSRHPWLGSGSCLFRFQGLPDPPFGSVAATCTHFPQESPCDRRPSRIVRASSLSHPEELFRVNEPEKAVRVVFRAISAREKKAVVTRRWAFLAPWIRIAPEWLVAAILGKA